MLFSRTLGVLPSRHLMTMPVPNQFTTQLTSRWRAVDLTVVESSIWILRLSEAWWISHLDARGNQRWEPRCGDRVGRPVMADFEGDNGIPNYSDFPYDEHEEGESTIAISSSGNGMVITDLTLIVSWLGNKGLLSQGEVLFEGWELLVQGEPCPVRTAYNALERDIGVDKWWTWCSEPSIRKMSDGN